VKAPSGSQACCWRWWSQSGSQSRQFPTNDTPFTSTPESPTRNSFTYSKCTQIALFLRTGTRICLHFLKLETPGVSSLEKKVMVYVSAWAFCFHTSRLLLRNFQLVGVSRNNLQHTAKQCNTLQHTATHCNTLQRPPTYCNTGSQGFARKDSKNAGCTRPF